MQTTSLKQLIDIQYEQECLTAFTMKKWSGASSSSVSACIEKSFNAGLLAAKFWINNGDLHDTLSSWLNYRKDITNWIPGPHVSESNIEQHDSIHKFPLVCLVSAMRYMSILQDGFSFEDECGKLYMAIKSDQPELTKFKPNGWLALRKNYTDFNGFKEYEAEAKDDILEFGGFDSASAVAGGFHERISLPNSMYDEVCQGRKALETLTGAAFAHGLFVATHNNTVNVILDLEKSREKLFTSENFSKIIFLPDLQLHSENLIVKSFHFIHHFHRQSDTTNYDSFPLYSSQNELDTYLEKITSTNELSLSEQGKNELILKHLKSTLTNPTYETTEMFHKRLKIPLNDFLNNGILFTPNTTSHRPSMR